MALLSTRKLVARAASAADVDYSDANRAFAAMIDVIGAALQRGESVNLEAFGRFAPRASETDSYLFRPGPELLEACREIRESTETDTEPAALPLRAEDESIIERYLSVRRGQAAAPVTVATLYDGERRRRQVRFLSESSTRTARLALRAFARRCQVPIMKVGLPLDGDTALFKTEDLRKEILAYAEDFQRRRMPKVTRLLQSTEGQARNQPPVVFRTEAWAQFVRYAYDFYEWLMEQGYRPPESNPLHGMDRKFFSSIKFNRGRIMIVRAWYSKILAHPDLTPKQRAVLYLLANSLRAWEAGGILIEHMHLNATPPYIDVVRKGGQLKTVYLMPWALDAVRAYLETRGDTMSPWLFPARNNRGHLSHMGIWRMVQIVKELVFPAPEEAAVRAKIHPHGFRHYYGTNAIASGMYEKAVQEQMGHRSRTMTQQYVSMDDDFIKKQHQQVSNAKWF
jgi:site-specific recombinase XerD